MEDIKGYKAFNKDKTNRYGLPFSEGVRYTTSGEISFGNKGNGYHICTHLSDVFRYVDAIDDEVYVAEVTGSGDRKEFSDEYEGYYEMYSVRDLVIDRFLSREEIIDIMLMQHEHDVRKFIITFRMTEEEKIRFLSKFRRSTFIREHMLYYQYGYKQIFEEHNSNEIVKRIKLVKNNGQNNS